MKLVVASLAIYWSLCPSLANASNNFGASCASCHSSALQDGGFRSGAMEVLGEGFLNLDSSRNDSNNRGAIPFFTAAPGNTVALAMQVVDGRTNYAVSIDNFETASITGSGTQLLTGYFQPDPLWFKYDPSPPDFYVNVDAPPSAIVWPAGQATPVPYTFNMTLSPSTPIATYELEYTLAGHNFGTPSLFVDSQFFYLQVVSPGDFDNSGQIDGADFLQWQKGDSHHALSAADLADWAANYGAAAALSAPATAVPEPSTGLLLVFSMLAACRQSRLLSRLTRSC